MSELSSEIGRLIAERREALGIKQADLAEQLQIGRSTMSQYETGKIEVKMPALIRIAKALNNTPIAYFFGEMSLLDIVEADNAGHPPHWFKCSRCGETNVQVSMREELEQELTTELIESIVRRVTDEVVAELRTSRLSRPPAKS